MIGLVIGDRLVQCDGLESEVEDLFTECVDVIQGLGAVGDSQSVDALKQALSDPNREVRLAAGWGLARMEDAGSVDALLKAADVKPGWERIQATKHCLVLAERLEAAGRKDLAQKIHRHLRDIREDADQG